MGKDFKTVDELITVMESRNLKTDSKTKQALMRESYYAIINGYKRPFLDVNAMESNDEDSFIEGTRFEWIYTLFLFDRELRNVTFKYLAQAEAIMKTSVVYAFCESNQAHDSYLQRSSYVDAKNMLFPKGFRGNKAKAYSNDMSNLMRILNGKLADSPARKPFITHYVNKYGSVPLWVLSNDLTFGNMAHFYQLQKRSVQNRACKLIIEAAGKDGAGFRLYPQELLHSFSVLSDFRNLCAHDERLYCSKVGRSGDIDYSCMAVELSRILPDIEYRSFLSEVFGLFNKFGNRLHVVTFESLLKDMGFEIVDETGHESDAES